MQELNKDDSTHKNIESTPAPTGKWPEMNKVIRLFYPETNKIARKGTLGYKIASIYWLSFWFSFITIFMLGFLYYFFLGEGSLGVNHFGEYSFGIPAFAGATFSFIYAFSIPDTIRYTAANTLWGLGSAVIAYIGACIQVKIDSILLAHLGISLGRVLLLTVYAYCSAIISMTLARLVFSTKYWFT